MWLREHKVPFTERKTQEKNVLKELLLLGYRTTPVLVVDDEIIVGFNPTKFKEALEL